MKTKKRILIYYKSLDRHGGIERVICNIACRLSSYYDITILTKDSVNKKFELNDSINIVTLSVLKESDKNRSIKNIIKSSWHLRKFLKHKSYDYIYTATIIETLEIAIANIKLLKITVASEHGSFFAYNKVYIWLRKILYRKIYRVIVPSTMDTEIYKEMGFPAVYMKPFINTSKVLEKMEKDKIVLNVGRLIEDKQQIILLNIWKTVVKEVDIDWKLYIVGSGSLEDSLRQTIKDLNLQKSVTLISATNEINTYYEKTSVFAFTSKMEGFGMVLIEAMSFSIPCLSFDCPSGPKDIIKNGYNGYLLSCFDDNKYAEMLIKIIKDEELRIAMSINAQDTIKMWNNEDILKDFFKVFK